MSTFVDRDGTRYHSVGDSLVACNASRLTEDCQLCNKEKQKLVDEWIKLHEKFCLLCDERPVCYLCLKQKCVDWCTDKQMMEEFGTLQGCRKLSLNTYCTDFTCKYGFVGWWSVNWKQRRLEIRKSVKPRIMKLAKLKVRELEKYDRDKKNAVVEKTFKKKTSARSKALVANKPKRSKIRPNGRPNASKPMDKGNNRVHRKKRIPMHKSRD